MEGRRIRMKAAAATTLALTGVDLLMEGVAYSPRVRVIQVNTCFQLTDLRTPHATREVSYVERFAGSPRRD